MVQINLVELDLAGEAYISELRKQIRLLADGNPKRVILNFEHVRYISSAALGELISAKRKIDKSGGRFVLAAVGDEVGEILHITRLDKAIRIYPTLDVAVKRMVNK